MIRRVELLIIGNEILAGNTLDTNSQWLAQQLLERDLRVNQILVIEDDEELIAQAIKGSMQRQTTLLITSGGLGPTFDDQTAKGLALAAGKKPLLNPQALKMIKMRYKQLKEQGLVKTSRMTPHRKKMALLPPGAEPLPNSVGTAPAIKFQINSTIVFCLPGVPAELKAIFSEVLTPHLATLTDQTVLQEIIQVSIPDESTLAPLIDKIMDSSNGIYLKSLPTPYQTRRPPRVVITVSAPTKPEAELLMQQAIKDLQQSITAHNKRSHWKRMGGKNKTSDS
ncbi:MAG: competence/damage-inducible protein A [Promethearchaeota archaeon]